MAAPTPPGTVPRLAAGSVALAVVLLDVGAVPVLLPSARLDLGSSSSGIQWAQNAQLLAVAALLLPMVRLAGAAGARAVAAGGAVVLAISAVVCAAAESPAVLVAGRAAAGAGAAALLGATLLPAHGAGRRERLAAAALPGLALGLGPLAGGVFAEVGWWRVFFWVGVPVAALALTAALLAVDGGERGTAEGGPLGPARGGALGPAALAAGLVPVTVVLVQSEPWGWGWTGVAVALAAGAVARLAWWRDPPPVAVTWLALGGCLASLAFLLPPYFELARGLSPVRSGLLMLTLTVPAAGAWWIVARPATARLASPATTLAGLGCAVVAMLALAALDADSSYRLPILALAVAGTGLGLAAGSVGLAALGPPAETLLAGAAIGAALVLGFAGALFQNEQAAEREAGASFEQALADGVGLAALGLAAVLLAGAAAAWRGSRAGGATRSASAARRAAGS